jgi:putative copper export protein
VHILIVDLLLRWAHILGAAILVGGALFWRCAVLPARPELSDETRAGVAAALRSRWSKLVMLSSGLLLVSGLINFMTIVTQYEIPKEHFPGSLYHMLFGVKFLLALAVFALASLLAGRSSAAERMRRNEKFWLNCTVALAIAIVCLGGLLRASNRQPKAAPSLGSAPEARYDGPGV